MTNKRSGEQIKVEVEQTTGPLHDQARLQIGALKARFSNRQSVVQDKKAAVQGGVEFRYSHRY